MLMLTTKDNPYNPDTQFDEWFAYDQQKGYNTTALLARFARTSPDLEPADYIEAIDEAIERILKVDITGLYTKLEVEVNDQS